MSADLINLRKARKSKARAAKESQAAENRAKFGQTKAERQRTEAEAALKIRRLDAHELGAGGRNKRDGDPDK